MITLPFCTQAGNLKDHLLTHSGEKTFPWTQCNFSCTQLITLKRHLQTHTGEKPFACGQCDYKCNRSSNLKLHVMRKHPAKNKK